MKGQQPGDGCTIVYANGTKRRGVYVPSGYVDLGRHEIARCKAHVASVCWIVRVWQKHSRSFVFASAHERLSDAIRRAM